MLFWLFIGLIMGVITRLTIHGESPGGFIAPILLGIVGALLGGYLGVIATFYEPDAMASWIGAAIGAFLLLFGYRVVLHKKI